MSRSYTEQDWKNKQQCRSLSTVWLGCRGVVHVSRLSLCCVSLSSVRWARLRHCCLCFKSYSVSILSIDIKQRFLVKFPVRPIFEVQGAVPYDTGAAWSWLVVHLRTTYVTLRNHTENETRTPAPKPNFNKRWETINSHSSTWYRNPKIYRIPKVSTPKEHQSPKSHTIEHHSRKVLYHPTVSILKIPIPKPSVTISHITKVTYHQDTLSNHTIPVRIMPEVRPVHMPPPLNPPRRLRESGKRNYPPSAPELLPGTLSNQLVHRGLQLRRQRWRPGIAATVRSGTAPTTIRGEYNKS